MEEPNAATANWYEGEPICRHHWMIEAPSGPTSRGVCQKCGEVRDFRNSLPDPPRDDDAFSHFYGKDHFVSRIKTWATERDPGSFAESYE